MIVGLFASESCLDAAMLFGEMCPLPEAVARSVWDTCKKKGDIYLDRYEGWCA